MQTKTLRTIVIDDDFHWNKIITQSVNAHQHLECVGSFHFPLDTYQIISEAKVDLILLDIEMPEINGVQFYKRLKNPPPVIFVTSHRDFAVESYDLQAIDYLIKPFDDLRFIQAIERFISFSKFQNPEKKPSNNVILIKENNRYYKLNCDDILFLKSLDNYVQIITIERSYTILKSLKELEVELPVSQFLRVHRSFIANINKITNFNTTELIINKHEIPIARSFADVVLNALMNDTFMVNSNGNDPKKIFQS